MRHKGTRKKIRIQGVYDYTVWLTYLGTVISVGGIMAALRGMQTAAVACLAASGLCDAFDGKVARTKTDRTEEEKAFGVQIDSLNDMVCFGIFPVVIFHTLGAGGICGMAAAALYCICGMIRLAQFNVLEAMRPGKERSGEQHGANHYRGLPITAISVALPCVYSFRMWISAETFAAILPIVMAVMALLFILDFPVPKPKGKGLAFLIAFVAAALLSALLGSGG